jgi:hypothetical protein
VSKKTLFVHIGMGKTGTTALQNFFWSNRRELGRHGIAYPEVGVVSGAHHLLSPHHPPFLKGQWDFMNPDQWISKILGETQDTVLLSSELMAWAAHELARDFCEAIRDHFDVRIVIYLRRQDNMIMASYNQQIKGGHQKRHLKHILEKQMVRFDYAAKLKPWTEALGREHILVRPYEKQQFHGGDLVRDFMHHVFGLELTDLFEMPRANTNPRLSYTAMEYKRMVNKLDDDTFRTSKFIPALLQYSVERDESSHSAFSTQSVLSPAQRLEIVQQCEPINSMIAQDYLGRSDGRLFHEELPDDASPWENETLTRKEAVAITHYIREADPRLLKKLVKLVREGLGSERPMRRKAAEFLDPCLAQMR